jgi:hypothetical protein
MTKKPLMLGQDEFATAFREPEVEMLRLQIDCQEILQTIKRTALRDNTTAKVAVWMPSTNPGLYGRLQSYFKGAQIESLKAKL